jgi:hypothetical protein
VRRDLGSGSIVTVDAARKMRPFLRRSGNHGASPARSYASQGQTSERRGPPAPRLRRCEFAHIPYSIPRALKSTVTGSQGQDRCRNENGVGLRSLRASDFLCLSKEHVWLQGTPRGRPRRPGVIDSWGRQTGQGWHSTMRWPLLAYMSTLTSHSFRLVQFRRRTNEATQRGEATGHEGEGYQSR